MASKTQMISIVVPLYNEEESVPLLVKKIAEAMRARKYVWELVAVNDGSRDGTEAALVKLEKTYPELKPVYLRRNYGQTAAMQAGFDHARGEVVVTLDGDLQNDPKDIPALLDRMDETGADIVSGWRKDRQDHALKNNLPSRIANRLLVKVTGLALHDSGCSLKAYRADLLKDLKIYGELHRFIPAVAMQYGAKVEEVVVTHHARQFGESKYGVDKTIRVALDLIQLYFFQKFLHRPMHFFGYAGLVLMVPGSVLLAYLFVLKLFGHDIGGRPLLIGAVMLVLLGVQLLGMGVLGELLTRIYHEPQGRKQYLTRAGRSS
ncbi:MAG: glycosyltransferase [Alphaproteobacteria bacterium]|nr:MAG: glycosyltransferase [Alphaproteobacteria bacterium]